MPKYNAFVKWFPKGSVIYTGDPCTLETRRGITTSDCWTVVDRRKTEDGLEYYHCAVRFYPYPDMRQSLIDLQMLRDMGLSS